jgi:hypothetical protein
MGTYYTNGTKSTPWKKFIFDEIHRDDHQIVYYSKRGSTAYLACKYVTKEGKTEVYALVLLCSQYGDSKGYKPVEESMGPFHCDAPKKLLDLLTPTDSEWANQWRARCLELAAKKKVKVGDKIRFNLPVTWGGKSETDFEVVKWPGIRGMVLESLSGKGLVRVTSRSIQNREKVWL